MPRDMTAPDLEALRALVDDAKRSKTGLGYNGQRINALGFWLIGHGDALLALAERAQEEEEEAFQIGKRDGREEAVQEIDRLTGGDGEYVYSTFPGEGCPGPADMIKRITERFEAQAEEIARVRADLKEDARVGVDFACSLAAERTRSAAQPAAERVGVPARIEFKIVPQHYPECDDADLPGIIFDEHGREIGIINEPYHDGFDYEAFGKALADAYNAASPAERAPHGDAGGGAES